MTNGPRNRSRCGPLSYAASVPVTEFARGTNRYDVTDIGSVQAALGVAVVAALGAVAACGPSGGGTAAHDNHGTPKTGAGGGVVTDALSALRIAATKTDQADSAKVDGTTVITDVSMAMNGELAWAHGLTGDVDIKMRPAASMADRHEADGRRRLVRRPAT